MILYTVTVRYTEELEHIHTNKCMKIVGEREREPETERKGKFVEVG